MLRSAVPALVALVLGAPASAATLGVAVLAGGDAAFNDLCSQGTGSGLGGGNQACEFAVGELRGGGPTTWEIGIQNPPGSPTDTKQFAWGNGTPHAFLFSYDAGLGSLSLQILEGTTTLVSSATAIALDGVQSMFLRLRDNDDAQGPGSVALTGMTLNAHALPDLAANGPGSPGAGYLHVFGIDWTQDWALAGVATFSWAGAAIPTQSRLNVNFKLTDVAPIPLPAAGWLLMSALAGLGALARRRRPAG